MFKQNPVSAQLKNAGTCSAQIKDDKLPFATWIHLQFLLKDCATLGGSGTAVEQRTGSGWAFLCSTFCSFCSLERRAAGSSLSPPAPSFQHVISHEEFAGGSGQIRAGIPHLPGEVHGAPEHTGVRGEAAARRDSKVTLSDHTGLQDSRARSLLVLSSGSCCERQVGVSCPVSASDRAWLQIPFAHRAGCWGCLSRRR